MEFTSQEDIEAPIEKVFAALTDFDTIERQAMRRGIAVRRHSPDPEDGPRWTAGFSFRGRAMEAEIAQRHATPPEALGFAASTGGLDSRLEITLTALTPARTRMQLRAELAPRTLSARLLVQSIRLARARMVRKFSLRVAQFARALEDRARKAA